jgi:2-polyprenyl-3-methyl-5-hydroxy-6-metoxy-1,4-benzoquinol methylase
MSSKIDHALERLKPTGEEDGLIASEHYGRYLWAAQLARGMNVLDAGCGTAYGTKTLAEAGASLVTGVDISEKAIHEGRETYGNKLIDLRQGDLTALPFSDGEFDLIVCFEVIEHVDDRDAVLAELKRVLKLDGLLCISTPNSRVYPPGNPYHIHEYEPEDFARTLAERFSHIALFRQSAWLTSGILSDREFTKSGIPSGFAIHAVKLDDKRPGEEIFTVALASSRELPSPDSIVVLGEPFEVRWWQEQIESVRESTTAEVNETKRQLHKANQDVSEARSQSIGSARRLLDMEEIVSGQNARIYALEEELDARSDRIEALSARVDRADRILAGITSSISWRITRPLRALKNLR